jgi:hypothetical protein
MFGAFADAPAVPPPIKEPHESVEAEEPPAKKVEDVTAKPTEPKQEDLFGDFADAPAPPPIKESEPTREPEEPKKPEAKEGMFGDFADAPVVSASSEPAAAKDGEEDMFGAFEDAPAVSSTKEPEPIAKKPEPAADSWGDFEEPTPKLVPPAEPPKPDTPKAKHPAAWPSAFPGSPTGGMLNKGIEEAFPSCVTLLAPPKSSPALSPPAPPAAIDAIMSVFQQHIDIHLADAKSKSSEKASKFDSLGICILVSHTSACHRRCHHSPHLITFLFHRTEQKTNQQARRTRKLLPHSNECRSCLFKLWDTDVIRFFEKAQNSTAKAKTSFLLDTLSLRKKMSKPEGVLKRAEDLIAINRRAEALTMLHTALMNRRFRAWSKAIEDIALKHVTLCAEMRKVESDKEGGREGKTFPSFFENFPDFFFPFPSSLTCAHPIRERCSERRCGSTSLCFRMDLLRA